MRTYIERAIHFDFHNPPLIPDLGDDFDATKFVDNLVSCKVKYINFFARCNLGYSYYPTQVGIRHPYLKDKDIFGDLLRECHKNGIGVTAYFNASLNHALADLHEEWNTLRKNGARMSHIPSRNHDHKFRNMCYDSGYAEHLCGEVKEIFELYPDLDGIFIDCFSFPDICFCPTCMENMKREKVDLSDERQLKQYTERKNMRMAKRLRALVPQDKNFIINGALQNGTCIYGRTKLDTHSEIECLVCDNSWGYDFFPMKVAYERNLFDNVVYMCGRFRESWGDFGGIRDQNGLEYDLYLGLLHCVEVSVGDHLHPRGVMERSVSDMVRNIYSEIEQTEKWTKKAKYIPEIGILHPINYNIERGLEDTPSHLDLDRLRNSFKGVVRMLSELKYQYDIIDDTMDLERYQLLIVPDALVFTEQTVKKVKEYMEKGGKIITTGQSALREDLSGFALPEYWNFGYAGENRKNVSYFKPVKEMSENIPDLVCAVYEQGILMEEGEQNEVLAEQWEPYFDRHWDGHQFYSYNPYDKKNEQYAACLKHENVIHINFKIFAAYQEYSYQVYRYFLDNCIKTLYRDKIMETTLPVFARASVAKCKDGMLLQVVSYCVEHKNTHGVIDEKIALYNTEFAIRTKVPKRIFDISAKKEIPFEYREGRAIFTVPYIDGHNMTILEY